MLHVRAGTRVGSQGVFPGDLPNPGIKPTSPALAGRFFTTDPPGKRPVNVSVTNIWRDEKNYISLFV